VTQHQLDRNLAEKRVVNRRVADGRQKVNVRQTVAARERERGANLGRDVPVFACRNGRARAVSVGGVVWGCYRGRGLFFALTHWLLF
jgi:hypothetical protein